MGITVNMGGTLTPTAAPGGIAGTGITALAEVNVHVQKVAPPPPPPTAGPYQKQTESSAGVTAMIDLLIKDLDKELQEAGVNEKDAQAAYEKTMAEAAAK